MTAVPALPAGLCTCEVAISSRSQPIFAKLALVRQCECGRTMSNSLAAGTHCPWQLSFTRLQAGLQTEGVHGRQHSGGVISGRLSAAVTTLTITRLTAAHAETMKGLRTA